MSDVAATLLALQFGDSFFPSGGGSFSWGLEGLVENGVVTNSEVEAFVIGQLRARWVNFDRAAVVAAHRARGDLEAVAAIDRQIEIQTPCAELRTGSQRMGQAMLALFISLGWPHLPLYRHKIKQGCAYGHIAPMQGWLWDRAGIGEGEAVALSAHSFCIGLLSAAIRLGCLTHVDAQRVLVEARKEVASLSKQPVPPLSALSSCGIEAEIAVMRHAGNDARVFAN
jgi:urease accessory protein